MGFFLRKNIIRVEEITNHLLYDTDHHSTDFIKAATVQNIMHFTFK